MDELLEQQVLEGNVGARDRRRKARQGGEIVVVENNETKQIRDQIAVLGRAIKTLQTKLKALTAAYNDISKKQAIVKQLQENEKVKEDFR